MRNTFIIIFILNLGISYAQDDSNILLQGKLISKDSVNIEFAHIYLKNNYSKATVSNDEGVFLLTINHLSFTDSVVLSHVGFKTEKVAVSDFKSGFIVLEANVLPEFKVFDIQANELVKKAIINLDKKYFVTSYNAKGFFREIMLENNNGVLINEIAFKSLLYQRESKNDKVEIIKGRKSNDYRVFKTESIFGVPSIFAKEPVRVKKEYLSIEGMNNYDYEIVTKTNFENNEVYIVEFSTKQCDECKNKQIRFGKIIIDAKDYSILELEYTLDYKLNTKSKTEELLALNRLAGVPQKTSIKIKYAHVDNFYYPFFYDVHADFLFAQEGKVAKITLLVKMLINETNFSKIKKVKNNYNLGKGASRQVKMEFGNDFFGIDAYVLPSEREKKAIDDILKRNL